MRNEKVDPTWKSPQVLSWSRSSASGRGGTLSPGAADTFNDILREVNTLKLLSSTGARNINFVLDSLHFMILANSTNMGLAS